MNTFAREISSNMTFRLLANYRSSNRIIRHAESVFPRTPPMFAAGVAADENFEPVYVHAATAFHAVRDHFLPVIRALGIPYGEAAVIAPWWVKLWYIGKGLREIGVPVVGPGARPYRRLHLLATLAEQVCAYIAQPSKKGFHQIERELFLLLNGVTGKWSLSVFSFQGSITVRKLIQAGSEVYRSRGLAYDWLREASGAFEDILKEDGFLPVSTPNLLRQSAEDMAQDIIKNKVDIGRLTTEELGLFASTERNMHLLTMHRAKGREFDAVAIIDLHEGRVPDFRAIRDCDAGRIEEDKRRLYVSITRARRFLMYVSDREDRRNVPSRFLCRGCLNLA